MFPPGASFFDPVTLFFSLSQIQGLFYYGVKKYAKKTGLPLSKIANAAALPYFYDFYAVITVPFFPLRASFTCSMEVIRTLPPGTFSR